MLPRPVRNRRIGVLLELCVLAMYPFCLGCCRGWRIVVAGLLWYARIGRAICLHTLFIGPVRAIQDINRV
jgi:hypothetical protein